MENSAENFQITKDKIWAKRPIIISGPCSAETEIQVLETAKRLAKTGKTDILRAGIWKPRTKPGGFEGVGVVGLPWLSEAKKITNLPTTVEVATAKHVEEALKFSVDFLWVGARTTVNPFSVQEIADALRGVKIPVFIKNPVNPDLELWVGAVERLEKSGISQIGLIHRGFSSYAKTQFRNEPMWQLPIEMRLRFPSLPMICDPSHICGNRHLLETVAQKSIDLGFDGLMLESHIDPENAWSDAAQQITPEVFGEMMNRLKWREKSVENVDFSTDLTKLRAQIDQIDDELVSILSRRMAVSDAIGEFKRQNNIAILQLDRWFEILQRSLAKAEKLGLSREFIEKYFEAIHMESIRHQRKKMKD